jgi:hypothetical protein
MCTNVSAQAIGGASPSAATATAGEIAVLERQFWVCDHGATTGDGVDPVACSVATEALKQAKFGGDYDKLVQWWQQNKEVQHRALDAAHIETARLRNGSKG